MTNEAAILTQLLIDLHLIDRAPYIPGVIRMRLAMARVALVEARMAGDWPGSNAAYEAWVALRREWLDPALLAEVLAQSGQDDHG